jgi:hypothetical protein
MQAGSISKIGMALKTGMQEYIRHLDKPGRSFLQFVHSRGINQNRSQEFGRYVMRRL